MKFSEDFDGDAALLQGEDEGFGGKRLLSPDQCRRVLRDAERSVGAWQGPHEWEVREGYSRSWADPRGAHVIGGLLRDRLREELAGERCLMVTLSYKHGERCEWDSPSHLWHRSNDERHVPLFIRKLSRALKVDLRGRWICKAEFQQGGWLHYHICLRGYSFLDRHLVQRCWPYGNIDLQKWKDRHYAYMSKSSYFTKEAPVPHWLQFGARVRLIRTSHGFWSTASRRESRAPDPECHRLTGLYVSVARRVAMARAKAIVRSKHGGYWSVPLSFNRIITTASAQNSGICSASSSGWTGLRDLPLCCMKPRNNATRRAARSAAAGALLDLSEVQYCDGTPEDAEVSYFRWVFEWLNGWWSDPDGDTEILSYGCETPLTDDEWESLLAPSGPLSADNGYSVKLNGVPHQPCGARSASRGHR